jgi:fumarate reductase subunit D
MKSIPRTVSYRRDILWSMAFVHRVSGVLLACFLPLHFLLLGSVLGGATALDRSLSFTAIPIVKVAEAGLVFLLAVHLLGGIRVLAIENLNLHQGHKRLVTVLVGVALAIAAVFYLRAA